MMSGMIEIHLLSFPFHPFECSILTFPIFTMKNSHCAYKSICFIFHACFIPHASLLTVAVQDHQTTRSWTDIAQSVVCKICWHKHDHSHRLLRRLYSHSYAGSIRTGWVMRGTSWTGCKPMAEMTKTDRTIHTLLHLWPIRSSQLA